MIDIIIPIYNSIKTLENTLNSIIKQTIKDKINVMLVDDNSTDNYSNIINKYSKLININYIKLNKNLGAGITRQAGLDNSDNEYIIFLDSDDLFYSTQSVQLLYNEIILGYDYVDSMVFDENKKINYKNDGDLHGKIYRRKFIKNHNIKFNETRYHEDNAFNSIVLINNPKKSSINEITYVYSDNKLSLTKADENKEWERLEVYIYNMKYVIGYAKDNDCSLERINEYLNKKYNYLNRIAKNLNDNDIIQLNDWLTKYGFKKISF